MNEAAKREESKQDRDEARTEASIVVSGASPLGEAVPQEMVVAIAGLAAEDVGDETEAGEALAGLLVEGIDFLLAGTFGHAHAGFLVLLALVLERVRGDEFLAGLVRVEGARLFAVGLVDVVEGRGGLDADEFVEGYIVAFMGLDFVVETEDFVVWRILMLATGKKLRGGI